MAGLKPRPTRNRTPPGKLCCTTLCLWPAGGCGWHRRGLLTYAAPFASLLTFVSAASSRSGVLEMAAARPDSVANVTIQMDMGASSKEDSVEKEEEDPPIQRSDTRDLIRASGASGGLQRLERSRSRRFSMMSTRSFATGAGPLDARSFRSRDSSNNAGRLEVTILKAYNLPQVIWSTGKDGQFLGLPQAYCVFSLNKQTTNTLVCKKDWNPIWDHTFTLDVKEVWQVCSIKVMHSKTRAKIHKDDHTIGACTLPVGQVINWRGVSLGVDGVWRAFHRRHNAHSGTIYTVMSPPCASRVLTTWHHTLILNAANQSNKANTLILTQTRLLPPMLSMAKRWLTVMPSYYDCNV